MYFIASFTEANSIDKITGKEIFPRDKNQNHSFIGEVQAGTARGTLINGTLWKKGGYKANQLYLCKNVTGIFEGKPQINTEIISEISAVELITVGATLGEGRLIKTPKTEKTAGAPTPESLLNEGPQVPAMEESEG